MNLLKKCFGGLAWSLNLLALFATTAPAQHSDIEFGYESGMIAVEFGAEGRVYEGQFPTSGVFEQQTDDPGFGSEVDEGLGVNPGDIIDYLILGPLVYHNGTAFAPVPAGASIVLGDNPSGSLSVDATTTGPISGPGAIAQADAIGEIHTHIEFELAPLSLDSAAYGAYGLLMQLTTDATGIDPSESFYVVFNFGLEESVFEGAVGDFARLVPEPSTCLLAVLALPLAVLRRR